MFFVARLRNERLARGATPENWYRHRQSETASVLYQASHFLKAAFLSRKFITLLRLDHKRKHDSVTYQKIHQRAQPDGDAVSDDVIDMSQAGHQFHQRQIAGDRNSAGG